MLCPPSPLVFCKLSELGVFLQVFVWAHYSLNLHLTPPTHPPPFSQCFLIINLKFRMDSRWGWRSLSLSPLASPPTNTY